MAERLGRYVVLKHLASGGMADVLLARTDGIEGFERHVVLKRIKSEHAKDRRFIEMFLDEARLAANLHHANVVQVHDIGEASGAYFFTMEYLHGEDLRSILSTLARTRATMPLGHVVSIISSAAAGLHHAHDRRGPDKKPLNIVHRDVTPSNILVGYDGSVKVVDFGIAKAALRSGETRSGSLKGKVSYMSPEQCKSLPIDRRSDVYSLGVVLYELATTTRLFKNDSDYLVMDAICNGKIPLPRVRRPGLPNELSTIIMTALATDPDRRYQTADELRVALDQFAAQQGLSSNAGSLASYLTKIFGERPEPWLDLVDAEPESSSQEETHANLARRSYTDLPLPAPEQTRIGTGSGLRSRSEDVAVPATTSAARLSKALIEPTRPSRPSRTLDRTSTRMAWEHEGALPLAPEPPPARVTPGKIGLVAVPVLLLAGLGVWKLAGSGGGEPAPQAAAVAATAAAPPTTGPAASTVTVTPVEEKTVPAPASVPAPPSQVSVDSPVVKKVEPGRKAQAPKQEAARSEAARRAELAREEAARKAELAKAEAAKQELAKAEAAKQELAKAEAARAEAAKAELVKQELAKAEAARKAAPPTIELQLARLSGPTVEAVASQHRKALSKCEGSGELHGDITVRFQINAAGRVVKSQVSSTAKNPKVSGCILKVIQGWQFPKPPASGAEGTYSMSYQ